ncbi:MAG: helix-turn-helix transcriptional regulator [Pseudonocardiaceae bacterium]
MVREPEELVEMRRVLGTELAAFRQAAALSQGQLARAVTVDRSTVAHIERGRSRGDERFWRIADDRCGADGVLLAGFHAWEMAKQDHDVRTREAQLAEARATADELRARTAPQRCRAADCPGGARSATSNATAAEPLAGLAGPLVSLPLAGSLTRDVLAAGPDEVVGQLARLLCGWIGGMNRRELIQLLGWAAGAAAGSSVVTGLDTGELERLAQAIVSPDRVDEQVIDHLGAILGYCKRQHDRLGPRAVLNTVLAQRSLVHDLLTECPVALRPRLLSVYSDMSASVAFYYFDLNDFDSAWYYGDQARAIAQDAGNTELVIHALGRLSYFASWNGKGDTGVGLAAAAQSLVRKSDDPLARVGTAARAGLAYAVDGQYEVCMAEFERAADMLASARRSVTESWAYFYNEGFLASQKSDCLLRLGRPQEAAASAAEGLALFDKSFVGSLAFCALRLGNAHLKSGEVDEAARVVGDAAGLAAQTRSARLVTELHTTRTRMQPWQNTQAVQGLDDQLAAHGLLPSATT